MIRSPVSTRRTGNKPPELVPQTGIFSRESSEEKEVPSTSSGSSGRSQIGAVRGNIPVDVRDAVSKAVGSGGKFLEPPKEVTAGRAGIQKLGDGAYKPFGPRSRSSSDAGSDTAFCDGGPGKLTCGEPVRHSDNGVSCDKCEKWFHTSCQAIPKPAFDALVKFKSLSWLCPPCKAAPALAVSWASHLVSAGCTTSTRCSGSVAGASGDRAFCDRVPCCAQRSPVLDPANRSSR